MSNGKTNVFFGLIHKKKIPAVLTKNRSRILGKGNRNLLTVFKISLIGPIFLFLHKSASLFNGNMTSDEVLTPT